MGVLFSIVLNDHVNIDFIGYSFKIIPRSNFLDVFIFCSVLSLFILMQGSY